MFRRVLRTVAVLGTRGGEEERVVTKQDRTTWQGSTPPSLIQQRMEIDRGRSNGWVTLWCGIVYLALSAFRLPSGVNLVFVVLALGAVVVIGMGVWSIRRARRTLAAFEAEHGTGAGKQDPIP
jgi:hypothetical protein